MENIYILEVFIRDNRIKGYQQKGDDGAWYLPLEEDTNKGYHTSVEEAEKALQDYIRQTEPENWPLKVYGARLYEIGLNQSLNIGASLLYLYDRNGKKVSEVFDPETGACRQFKERDIVEFVHFDPDLKRYVAELAIVGHNNHNHWDYLVIRQTEGSTQDEGESLFSPSLPIPVEAQMQLAARIHFHNTTVKCLLKYKGLTSEEIRKLREGKLTEDDIRKTHEFFGEQP